MGKKYIGVIIVILSQVLFVVFLQKNQVLLSFNTRTTYSKTRLYEVDELEAEKLVSVLGFAEKNLQINYLSSPSKEQGYTLRGQSGEVQFASYLESDKKDTLAWNIYVNDDYIKNNGSHTKEEVDKQKQEVMTDISLRSFINISSDPSRSVTFLFPVDTRPNLFKIK